MTEALGRWNRCQEIVPSGIEAPRTYRCWWPLPCPHHPHEVERVAATMRVHRSILDPC